MFVLAVRLHCTSLSTNTILKVVGLLLIVVLIPIWNTTWITKLGIHEPNSNATNAGVIWVMPLMTVHEKPRECAIVSIPQR